MTTSLVHGNDLSSLMRALDALQRQARAAREMADDHNNDAARTALKSARSEMRELGPYCATLLAMSGKLRTSVAALTEADIRQQLGITER